MHSNEFSRRELLAGAGLTAIAGVTAGFLTPQHLGAESEKAQPSGPTLNVRDFGARGDGKNDDTGSFTKAMQAAVTRGVHTVFIPVGRYFIGGNLSVPPGVSLQGAFQGPARTSADGSVLLALADPGKADGKPFISVGTNCALRGLTVFYPEQKMTKAPVPYPWTIRGHGDNISLLNLLLVNPYQGVDFGTNPAGRHFISGLYGQPLYRGLFIDQCYDVGRVENVHFWSFWGGWDGPLYEFMRKEAVAFVIGRTDWEFLTNCFCIAYQTGFKFVQTAAGTGNCVLTQCGSDIGPVAVRVENCQSHAGLSFVNGQFMAGIEIAETNTGPVKFTACGFWGIPSTDRHATLAGSGHTTFNGCHFIGWGQKDLKAPAIHAKRGGLTVTGCDFMDLGKAQILIEPEIDAALVYGNRLREKNLITNRAGERAQIGMNVVSAK